MRRRLSAASWLWLVLGSAYFVLPLVATFVFSTQTSRHGHSLDAYATVLREAQFRSAIFFSLRLAIATIVVSTLLLVPTAYWVHLKLPRLRPLMELTTILPLVVPPIVLVVGLAKTFQSAPGWVFGEGSAPFHIPAILVGAYTVLAFPYVYRSVDTGLRAIDIHTLTEASLSLGASWTTTIARVIVPNLRPAVLNGAFLTLACLRSTTSRRCVFISTKRLLSW